MTAAKTPQCLSSLKQTNLFTVAHASQSASHRNEGVPIWTSVLTRKMHGQGEDAILKEKRKKDQPAFSKNTNRANVREALLFWHD
jgi:hypothetical protein